ncbi:MAG: helix-turn-helix domain-containing protein [Burkholderiales bacterium]
MTRKFSTLRERMSPKARARAHARADAMIAEMALPELRRALKVSQEDLAKLLEVTQANVSKIESRADLHLSTLVAYIEALGGEVEILARFPKKAGAAGEEVVRLKPLPEKEAV